MATPFLVGRLPVGALLEVSIAWGADLAAAPGTWTWTDITDHVRQADGIDMKFGRTSEASNTQPAQCSVTLDNRTGNYSYGGQSANWPNVRRSTPVRVRVDVNGLGWTTQFAGFADGFTPKWDSTGLNATVALEASGTLRRLAQGVSPVLSPMRRLLLAKTRLRAYWPCEDGKTARTISSGIEGHPPMTISGSGEQPFPAFASDDSFLCSAKLPEMKLTKWTGLVPAYTNVASPAGWQVRWLMKAPLLMNGTNCVIVRIMTTGTIDRWDLLYQNANAGDAYLRGYTGNTLVFEQGVQLAINNTLRRMQVRVRQSGTSVVWDLEALGVGYVTSGGIGGTQASQTVGDVTSVTFAPNANIDDTIVGHISVENDNALLDFDYLEQMSFDGELVTDRLTRLCADAAVPLTIIGTSDVQMGPQSVSTLIKLLRECEAADQGLLYDGLDFGLTYVCRSARETAATIITLNAATGQPAKEIAPVDDDARTTNKVKADRTNGSSATFEDADGPMGTTAIGIYDDSIEVNVRADVRVGDYASWLVHAGTREGYRYPKMRIDLAAKPALAPEWANVRCSDRVDVTNVSSVRAQHPTGTLALLLEGYSQTINQFRWDVTLNTSSYEPWRLGTAAGDTGDGDADVMRLTSDGSTLAAGYSIGATSLSVATASGPLWTTTADDFPLTIDVGGIPVTVTAITGASSPQTFTVTGVTKALTSGWSVQVWQPLVVGL